MPMYSLLKFQIKLLGEILTTSSFSGSNNQSSSKSKKNHKPKKKFNTNWQKEYAKQFYNIESSNHAEALTDDQLEFIGKLRKVISNNIVGKANFILLLNDMLKNWIPENLAALAVYMAEGEEGFEVNKELAVAFIKHIIEFESKQQAKIASNNLSEQTRQAALFLLSWGEMQNPAGYYLLGLLYQELNDDLLAFDAYNRGCSIKFSPSTSQQKPHNTIYLGLCSYNAYKILSLEKDIFLSCEPYITNDEKTKAKYYYLFLAEKHNLLEALLEISLLYEANKQFDALIICYRNIINTPVDLKIKSLTWYKLGKTLENHFKNSSKEAFEAYEWSAECGGADACYRLGFAYFNGDHFKKNLIQANIFFEKAIERYLDIVATSRKNIDNNFNLSTAYYNLASIFYAAKKNLLKAYYYYKKSLGAGEESARERLVLIKKDIKTDQVKLKIAQMMSPEGLLNIISKDNTIDVLVISNLEKFLNNKNFREAVLVLEKLLSHKENINAKEELLDIQINMLIADCYINISKNYMDENALEKSIKLYRKMEIKIEMKISKGYARDHFFVINHVIDKKNQVLSSLKEQNDILRDERGREIKDQQQKIARLREQQREEQEKNPEQQQTPPAEIFNKSQKGLEKINPSKTHEPNIYKVTLLLEKYQIDILKILKAEGNVAYITGEFIPTKLLGGFTDRLEIVTSLRPEQILVKFPQQSELINAPFPMVKIKCDMIHIYILTLPERNTQHCDQFLLQSDAFLFQGFTITSMFYDAEKQVIIDYLNGYSDFEKKLIKFYADKSKKYIVKNPLLFFSAFRMVAKLKFNLSQDLDMSFRHVNTSLLGSIDKHQLCLQFFWCFNSSASANIFSLLNQYNILTTLFPSNSNDKFFYQQFINRILVIADILVIAKSPISFSLIFATLFFEHFTEKLVPKKEYDESTLISLINQTLAALPIDLPVVIQTSIQQIWLHYCHLDNLVKLTEFKPNNISMTFYKHYDLQTKVGFEEQSTAKNDVRPVSSKISYVNQHLLLSEDIKKSKNKTTESLDEIDSRSLESSRRHTM